MDRVEIPSYFLCPISLQIMRDPVIVSTGITYDRENMEKWIYIYKKKTCPMTNLAMDPDLTPNHTLRCLIKSWCIIHASNGVECVPSPRPPIPNEEILHLLSVSRGFKIEPLSKLKVLAMDSEIMRRRLEAAGAVKTMVGLVLDKQAREVHNSMVLEEALCILHLLQITEDEVKHFTANGYDGLIESLAWVFHNGSNQSKLCASLISRTIFKMVEVGVLMGLKDELFRGMVHVLVNRMSNLGTKAVLHALMEVCTWGRNGVKACKAGLVPALVEFLIETLEEKSCELLLGVLDLLCGISEGRSELLKHRAGLAVVSKKILRVSPVADEHAVNILWSICKYCDCEEVSREMLQVGAVAKLCIVVNFEGDSKAKRRARKVLVLKSREWKYSSCVPGHLLSRYP
ncbi:hypothetical protein AMTRI_Chr11g152180 [Amborella trichopoda]|uniref:U-box domain-containing protein n=1 Tax=Amborella trichopoda TaxID=13333 RepID=U5CS89_AMBTC|nr:E3 ubiquitin-protein ligase PUB23 [Amborella trichopoda]ERN16086.1 hypothetical protein AMTR_s00030p00161650 [Amborella trichopoda]|eukprot:XP_006854619.1 E3 ubiquitin-protein ligase PUB23 [Amborella trichopoda]